jgi:sugar lactone lactonase YvrE
LTGGDDVIEVGSPLGAFAARERGGFVLAVKDGFAFLDLAIGRYELVAPVEKRTGSEMRMYDGKCDQSGRFWAGSMAVDVTRGAGSLYRLDPDLSVNKVLDGVTASNGLDWSDHGNTLCYIDSLAARPRGTAPPPGSTPSTSIRPRAPSRAGAGLSTSTTTRPVPPG